MRETITWGRNGTLVIIQKWFLNEYRIVNGNSMQDPKDWETTESYYKSQWQNKISSL